MKHEIKTQTWEFAKCEQAHQKLPETLKNVYAYMKENNEKFHKQIISKVV